MNLEFMFDRFEDRKDGVALVWKGRKFRYGFFVEAIKRCLDSFEERGIGEGGVVALEGEAFGPIEAARYELQSQQPAQKARYGASA